MNWLRRFLSYSSKHRSGLNLDFKSKATQKEEFGAVDILTLHPG